MVLTDTDWKARAAASLAQARAERDREDEARRREEDERAAARAAEIAADLREHLARLGVPTDGVSACPAVVDGVRFALRYGRDNGSCLVAEHVCPACGEMEFWQYVRTPAELGAAVERIAEIVADEALCQGCRHERAEREWRAERRVAVDAVPPSPTVEQRLLALLHEVVDARLGARAGVA